MLFYTPQKHVTNHTLRIDGVKSEQVNEFNFPGIVKLASKLEKSCRIHLLQIFQNKWDTKQVEKTRILKLRKKAVKIILLKT